MAVLAVLTCVQEQVILKVGMLAEPSVAYVTLEWPGPIVNIHVRFEVPGCRERLGAQSTFMRLLLQQICTTSTVSTNRNHVHFNISHATRLLCRSEAMVPLVSVFRLLYNIMTSDFRIGLEMVRASSRNMQPHFSDTSHMTVLLLSDNIRR